MNDHVFICYSRKDEYFALEFATNLKRHGVPTWLDKWDIPSGVNWPRAIQKALDDCAKLLVILSPSSVDSDEVQAEWYEALDRKKIVIPILYQPCRIPFRLKPIHYIDFTAYSSNDEKPFELVLRALGKSTSTISTAQGEHEQEKTPDWNATDEYTKISNTYVEHPSTRFDISGAANRLNQSGEFNCTKFNLDKDDESWIFIKPCLMIGNEIYVEIIVRH
jgi:hypothetical protein